MIRQPSYFSSYTQPSRWKGLVRTGWIGWPSGSTLGTPPLAPRARGGALAEEAEPPAVESEVGRELQADRGLGTAQRLPEHAGRTGRGPRERVTGGNDAGI